MKLDRGDEITGVNNYRSMGRGPALSS